MSRTFIIALLCLISGLVIGLNLEATPTAKFEDTPERNTLIKGSTTVDRQFSELVSRISLLENRLDDEIKARESMTQQLTTIKQKLEETSKHKAKIQLDAQETLPELSATAIPTETISIQPPPTPKEVLLSLGVEESLVVSIKEKAEKRELNQLYLRNQATREGWYGTERYFEQAKALESKSNLYREELGDEKYDEYLYQSGQFNRVSVKTVLSGSPAAEVGVESGDIIYSYDKNRLFTWMELTDLTSRGNAGDLVALEVLRGEQIMEIYIPRGPLGVRLSGKKVAPSR